MKKLILCLMLALVLLPCASAHGANTDAKDGGLVGANANCVQLTNCTNTGTINNYGTITLASGSVINNTGTIRDYGTISSDGATWTGNEAIRP